jgi:hypothetical protein
MDSRNWKSSKETTALAIGRLTVFVDLVVMETGLEIGGGGSKYKKYRRCMRRRGTYCK